jgi:thiol-disulfide isomerase/thioredoxin
MEGSTRSRGLTVALVGGVAAVLFGVAFAATRLSGLQGQVLPNQRTDDRQAPGFTGIDAWLNSEPLALDELRGKVVLVDFWTFSCVNCVRTFPFLRDLYDRYRSAGLEIVGVHAPEFDFERDETNVAAAIKRHDLRYPVALDNEMSTWRAYRNLYWPHVYLIDAEGTIRFDHIGEGGEHEIEQQVRSLLAEAGGDLPARLDNDEPTFTPHITPEVYAGFERGNAQRSLANPEGWAPGNVTTYADVAPAEIERAGTDGRFFLEGRWRITDEYVEAVGSGARVVLPFYARDVFIVAGGPARASVLLEDVPADGPDVVGGIVEVDRDDLFHVLRLDEPSERILTLEVTEGYRLFTFTFG